MCFNRFCWCTTCQLLKQSWLFFQVCTDMCSCIELSELTFPKLSRSLTGILLFSTIYWGYWLILVLRGCYISFTTTAVPIIIHLCTIILNTFFWIKILPIPNSNISRSGSYGLMLRFRGAKILSNKLVKLCKSPVTSYRKNN